MPVRLSDLRSLGEVTTGGMHPAEGDVGGGSALVALGGPTRSGNGSARAINRSNVESAPASIAGRQLSIAEQT